MDSVYHKLTNHGLKSRFLCSAYYFVVDSGLKILENVVLCNIPVLGYVFYLEFITIFYAH